MTKKKVKKRTAKKKNSKFKVFLKYLAVFVLITVVLYFMFVNRHEIKYQVADKVEQTRELVIPSKNKSQQGYSKEDRKNLEMLIHEEAKND